MKFKFPNRVLLILSLLIGCLLVTGILVTYRSIRALQTSTFWVAHTESVMLQANKLIFKIKDMQLSRHEHAVTGPEKTLQTEDKEIKKYLDSLYELTGDNPLQHQKIDSIIILTSHRTPAMAQAEINLHEENVLRLLVHLQTEENRLLLERQNTNLQTINRFDNILFVLLSSLILLLLLFHIGFRSNLLLQEKIALHTVELEGICERTTDGFIVLDKNFHCTYANRRIGEMTNRNSSSLIGKSIWESFPEAVGSDRYNFFHKAFKEQTYQFHIDYNPQFDQWQENYIHPSPNGLSIFVRDITLQKRAEENLKQSERMYKTVVSNIPGSLILLLDVDYRYFLIEGDLLEKLGYIKEQLLGKKMKDVVPAARYAEILPLFERVFAGELFSVERNDRGADYVTRFVPLKDENKKIYAAMLLMIDVTELKQAERSVTDLNAGLEQKIIERTQELASANNELEAFSYSVAHDLRTPLRAVAGYSDMLKEDYGGQFDEEGRRLLSELQYNNKKMGNLIDDLLMFSRLGRKAIVKSKVDMNALIQSSWRELPPHTSKLVTHELYPLIADGVLLKHVMINLLSNAVKYSSKNKTTPTITISSEHHDGWVTYCVRDNGVGFDMAYAGKLFGVFQRLHSQEEFEGTGVGLAIVQRIVNRHGGKVWAHGEINKGAAFFFSLPDQELNLLSNLQLEQPEHYAIS
jgi:PAS domain S-box-containing protein